MAFQALENYLGELSAAAEEHQALATVASIESCVKKEMSVQEENVALGLIAGPQEMSLAQQVKRMKDTDGKVRIAILKFLKGYLHHVADRITPYASNLQNVCFHIMCKSSSIAVKNLAFPLFQDIQKLRLDIEHVAGSTDFTPPHVFTSQLFTELRLPKSKLGGPVRGMMLATLGLLGDLHGLDKAQAAKLASLYMNILHQEMQSAAKPEPKLVEGIFSGLKYFLNEHSELVPVNAKKKVERLEYLFECLKLTIKATSDASRFNVLRAGPDLHFFYL